MLSFFKETMQQLFSTDDKLILPTSIVTAILTLVFVYIQFKSAKKEIIHDNDWSSLYSSASTTPIESVSQTSSSDLKKEEPTKLKNVFDIKQNNPIKSQSSTSNNNDNSNANDKPFNSSYYYAHNNLNSGGGYKDGIKAEDYVMNGPKLLSKVTKSKEESTSVTDSITITRYLWDDDGNSNGIAKIIIDTLPSSSGLGSTTVPWEACGIVSKDDVRAKLTGLWKNGLIIQIRRNINIDTTGTACDDLQQKAQRYQLHIPRLFGEADKVALILKAKKLIVKIYKKTEKTENLKAWPQLASKVAPSSSSESHNGFDEDLFL